MSSCPAVANILGEHYPCQMDAPHPGLAHANSDGAVIWTEDAQALTDAWSSAEADGR